MGKCLASVHNPYCADQNCSCDKKEKDDKRGGALSNLQRGNNLLKGEVVLWTIDTTPVKNEACEAFPPFDVRPSQVNNVTDSFGQYDFTKKEV